ncbi:MAG: DUF262 domain-containing protein [Pedobacter sp.]
MKTQKYSVNQHLLESILAFVNTGEIAIPEIQRPFVWDATKVRDLMDSLYQGYPIGYLIAWRNPDVKLKDGRNSEGKKILIDGQQRVTALSAAILGHYIIDQNYRRRKIRIAFHPDEEKFEVTNPAIEKDKRWVADIAPLVSGQVGLIKSVKDYCEKNPDIEPERVEVTITNLMQIPKKQIGLIELASDLDIETVTEVFIRINSKGVVLSQADFAMSKIASNETYGGSTLRKAIDYFCHLAIAPEFYPTIVDVDQEFVNTDYFQKMSWLKNENDNLYDPDYTDLLRVAFVPQFNRGKFSDLVSLLSGRNFETKQFEEDIAQSAFEKLKTGILDAINETHFKRFLMIIRSAGFIDSGMIRSQNALNFAYVVYLKLRSQGIPSHDIEKFVRRWFAMSVLTGRYSASPESSMDFDIRQIESRPFGEFLQAVEDAALSDAFWDAGLVQSLNTSVSSSPYLNVFWAAQIKANDKGFLSRDITVTDLVSHKGDIHHIFPRDYLKRNGLKRGQYNQIANYVYMQSEINIKIGNKAPQAYFDELTAQCNGGTAKYGAIGDIETLKHNLGRNCIPNTIFDMTLEDYDDFLLERRVLMAQKMRDYYFSL